MKDLLKHLQGQDSGQWANNKVSSLDRTLGELSRILEKQVRQTERAPLRRLFPCFDIIPIYMDVYPALSFVAPTTFSLLQSSIVIHAFTVHFSMD